MFSAPWFRLFDMSFAPCPTMPSSHSAAPSFWCASLSQRLEPPRCIGGLWTGGPNQTGSGLLRGHSKPIRSRFVSQASQTGDLFVKQGPLVHKVVLWFVSLVVRVSRIKTLARRIRCSCVCVCVYVCVCACVCVCVCVCVSTASLVAGLHAPYVLQESRLGVEYRGQGREPEKEGSTYMCPHLSLHRVAICNVACARAAITTISFPQKFSCEVRAYVPILRVFFF